MRESWFLYEYTRRSVAAAKAIQWHVGCTSSCQRHPKKTIAQAPPMRRVILIEVFLIFFLLPNLYGAVKESPKVPSRGTTVVATHPVH